jgi:hypothetical protein
MAESASFLKEDAQNFGLVSRAASTTPPQKQKFFGSFFQKRTASCA